MNVPRMLIAAWIREVRRTTSTVKLDDHVQSPPVHRTRSLLQGDPAAPTLFNATLDQPARLFHAKAQVERWGIEMPDGSFLAFLLFADNFWMIANSARELSVMTKHWLQLLAEYGWGVPLSEVKWCTTASDTEFHEVVIDGQTVRRAGRKVGFKALGVLLTFDNSNEAELDNRISSARRAFYKYSYILCCRDADMGQRLKLLHTLVHHALFWCCGSWNLTVSQCSKLRGEQQSMMRKMLCMKRTASETLEDYMIKTNRKIKHLKEIHNIRDWDWSYHRSVFAWAGHIARLE
eukprot:12414490-Karenia_brevis.AAC.1